MNVTLDKLMTQEAFVIERTLNGIIVRPHFGWWRPDREQPMTQNEVRVFNNREDFERWFAPWFPQEKRPTTEGAASPTGVIS